MTFFAIAGTLAHIANGSDLFSFNFGFVTFNAIAGTLAHIADESNLFSFNFGFMTFLQLLGQWHILQMGVIYFVLILDL